jgi:cellulose biosynthesis protein BcsQ
MKTIVFFNNKGGVGKTTLACNVVSFLNLHKSKRVLLIDADPQCNATQAILAENECERIYLSKEGKTKTLFDYLSPIEEGESSISAPVFPILGQSNKFGTDLIPGHPKMSLVEDKLSAEWSQLHGLVPAAFRITNWCYQLFGEVESRYDLVVFDVGPSLGALNRTVLLSCDYLVTPFGCDIFSLLGIQNISFWIKGWKHQYDRAIKSMSEDRPEILRTHAGVTNTEIKFRFAGYSVQQYVTRTFKETGRRPVKAYERIMNQIPSTVREYLDFLRPSQLTADALELGHIPYLYSLVPLAQAQRVPIHRLKHSGKLVGSQFQQVDDYLSLMEDLARKLLTNIGAAS